MDFVTLRLFCAVARTRSITKGAAECHIATSAASRRLSDFESATGSKLLKRSSRGVSLTAAGYVAMQHAMRLSQGFDHFASEIRDHARGMRGHVRLWANTSALTEFLPKSLSTFLEQRPDIRVDVEEQLTVDIVLAVTDGIADIGVFSDNVPAHGLDVLPYQVDQLVLVCPRDHPLAKHDRIDFKSCLDYDIVGLNQGSAILDLISSAAAAQGYPLRIRVQVRSFDAICQMIAAGLGVGVLPLAACEHQLPSLGLRSVALSDEWATRRLVAGVRSLGDLSPSVKALLEHLIG